MANALLDILGKLITGAAAQQQPQQQQAPQMPNVPVQKGPRPMPPMVLPPNGPMPQPRPQLPGGTFTPNKQPLRSVPTPQPRPMQPSIPVQTAPPAPGLMVQQPQQNPLAAIFGGGASGGDWRQMMRAAANGMAAIDPNNDDPFSTFGNTMSAATGTYDARKAAEQTAALTADQTAYERSQDAISNRREDANLELRRAAEARAAKAAGLANEKSAIEIKRLAAANGVTPKAYLDAREKARKEVIGNGDLTGLTGEERDIGAEIEKRTEEILQGAGYDRGLSKAGGLSSSQPITATNPETGERLRYDAAAQKWVPMQ